MSRTKKHNLLILREYAGDAIKALVDCDGNEDDALSQLEWDFDEEGKMENFDDKLAAYDLAIDIFKQIKEWSHKILKEKK